MVSEIILGLGIGILFVVVLGYATGSQVLAVETKNLSQAQENAVRIALANEEVKLLLMNKHAEVGVVQVGGVTSGECRYLCSIITLIQIEDTEKSMTVIVDMTSGEVVTIADSRWT